MCVSLCSVYPFSLEKVGTGQQARQTGLILNLPVPPLTLYSYRYGIYKNMREAKTRNSGLSGDEYCAAENRMRKIEVHTYF